MYDQLFLDSATDRELLQELKPWIFGLLYEMEAKGDDYYYDYYEYGQLLKQLLKRHGIEDEELERF